MTVSELNTRVIVKDYTTTQDATTGKAITALTASWTKWAKVVEDSGSRTLDNAAVSYRKAYTITFRYEQSRNTLEDYLLEFKGEDLKVHSVIREFEGCIWWEKIKAYTSK